MAMSHAVAIILLFLYCTFMVFQMWTHAAIYSDDDTPSNSTRYEPAIANVPRRLKRRARRAVRMHRKKNDEEIATATGSAPTVEGQTGDATVNGDASATTARAGSTHTAESEDEEEVPQMNMPVTLIVMVLIAVVVGVTAEFLVDSINGMVEANPSLSAEWVGLILLPILSFSSIKC